MGIKRYYATKDSTITNAFEDNLTTRGTGSNMGASDILEAFVIHGETSASINATNAEQSRFLIQFPIDNLKRDILQGTVPSGNLEYRLRLYNSPHADTLPKNFYLDVTMVSSSWDEGNGLDMENYSDLGECNWGQPTPSTAWTSEGGDVHLGSANSGSAYFKIGTEDLDIDVSFAVDQWRSEDKENYGFLIKNTDPVISGTLGSYFTKKFFGRTTEFFFYRPVLEVRWDSSRQDNRGNFTLSSSLAPAADNINTLHLYNKIRGELKDIPNLAGGLQYLLVNIHSGSNGIPSGSALRVINSSGESVTNITGGLLVENAINITGTYSASFASTSSYNQLCDVWFTGSGVNRVEFFTGSFDPQSITGSALLYDDEYITDVTNLKSSYIKGQKPRLRTFVRKKDWCPNIYTSATQKIEPIIVDNAYYRLTRAIDNKEIIPFGTGSIPYTKLSYDVSGNYFELDTSILEKGYIYQVQFLYYLFGQYKEQPEVFKFRVEEEN
jgi:hypothetical protein